MSLLRLLVVALTLSLLGGLNYFLYRRLVHDVTGSLRLRRLGAGAIVVMFASLPASRLLPAGHPLSWAVAMLVFAWWGLGIFTLLALAAVELVRAARRLAPPVLGSPPLETQDASVVASGIPTAPGFELAETPAAESPGEFEAQLSRRRFVARGTAAGAVLVGGGLSGFGAWRAFAPPQVTEFALKLPGLPKALEGFTIVQLSDLHIGPLIQGRFVDRLVEITNRARPDLVAITGDLVDGSPEELGPFVARLADLRSRHGTYFVSGNHDYYSGWRRWKPWLERLGFNVLGNRRVAVGDAGASFDLLGVEDWGGRFGPGAYDLELAAAGRDPDRASVLLAHQPNGLELAASEGIGLQLSGHTHGGQLFPGTLIGKVLWGERNAGLCVHQGTHLYTSRGCGFVGPPMRVGAPPEIARISLLPG